MAVVHILATMTEKDDSVRTLLFGTPLKRSISPPLVLNARTDLPRPLLRPLTQPTTPANRLPPSSGLCSRFAALRRVENRFTPCKGDQKLTFHNAQRFRHRDTQNPPKLLNTHLGYSQELWNVLSVFIHHHGLTREPTPNHQTRIPVGPSLTNGIEKACTYLVHAES